MEFKSPEASVVSSLGVPLTADLARKELRFHYSQQYFAEAKGEEVFEDILQKTYSKRQRMILNAQLKDEVVHERLYRKLLGRHGEQEGARDYGNQFCQLVKKQNSLAEKIFVFQILAESVSAGYCQWRLFSIDDGLGNEIDQLVADDEIRHLRMGHCFLSLCDQDELDLNLSKERKAKLLREMVRISRHSLARSFVDGLEIHDSIDRRRLGTTAPDHTISRILLAEARRTEAALTYEDIMDFYNHQEETQYYDPHSDLVPGNY